MCYKTKGSFFYTVKKEVPTIGKLLAQLKEDIDYDGSREHLRKLLKKIGFLYKKCKTNRQALIEKPVIAHKRERYLKIIMDNRNLPEELQKDINYMKATSTPATNLKNAGSHLKLKVLRQTYQKERDGL